MKATAVVYVDVRGAEHDALVRAVNGLNPGYVDLAYVDSEAPESDNMKTVFAVPHMDDDSQKEPNPALPTIHLNVWKEHYRIHNEPASDHPMFDHPFAEKEKDEFGQVLEPARPEYEAQIAAHQESVAGLPSEADLDSAANDAPPSDAEPTA
jgi:hypothetical protein